MLRRVLGGQFAKRLSLLEKDWRIPTRNRREPPEAGLPVPAIPPRGPLPLQGGAEAPLKFD